MARPLRIDIADGVYHVTSRGLERRRMVRDDADRERWVRLLDRVAARRQWRVYAWVLLDNHFHLFLRTPHADLSPGMHDLNAGYASGFNRRWRRHGPLFQGRFHGIVVQRDYHYWELSRYVHLSPLRARITSDPEEYAWGSCRLFFRSSAAPEWLAYEEVLMQHGRTLRAARRAYRRFLQEGIMSRSRSPLAEVTASTLLGTRSYVDRMRAWLDGQLPDRDVPAARQLRQRVGIAQVEEAVREAFGVGRESLLVRGCHANDARMAAVYLCRSLTTSAVRELGDRFGRVSGQAISKTARHVAERRVGDKRLDRLLTEIEAKLTKS